MPPSSQHSPKSQALAGPETDLSPYEVMLASADYFTNPEGAAHPLPPEYPVYYFFYGTLTAPVTIKRILDLAEEPKVRKAQIIGYALGKWGDYPALIDGEQGQVVSGAAYLVESEEQAEKLAYYETNAYKVAPCWIFFTDNGTPAEASGKTFEYAGDPKALLEQRFDRKLWALQMGNRLG
ncbi:predicted protein [Uncinocarpus reesii 1704]|uniref:Putative gamma-glutamylcyclotransferase n=1 Tax=Uncinocarpus reesii (strain UAMH 1704) TaxID=336963 RepID=C4JFG0_UNCRE|nr:uncharacterized protein UREG_00974 [Uncinocarpus reesii 1704]EEP76125.1 predicted protein [Uncinocarpus reesii 1704]